MNEIRFYDGLPKRLPKTTTEIYPEDIIGKKCEGCSNCVKREDNISYYCQMQRYDKNIFPNDKACIGYRDKIEENELERLRKQDVGKHRKELWAIYSKRKPAKIVVTRGMWGEYFARCPVCDEIPYSFNQCYWCGQRFENGEETKREIMPNEVPGHGFDIWW